MNTSRFGQTVLGITALLTTLSACGTGSITDAVGGLPIDPHPSAEELAIVPVALMVEPGGAVQFTVSPSHAALVTWLVAEPNGGTIDGNGRYTAPDSEGTFTVTAESASHGAVTATVVVALGAPSTSPSPPPPSTGTGATSKPSFLTSVTGGGSMPSTAGAPTASCAGDGAADDTACLQNAINAAAAAGKPLLIPATSSHYRISTRLLVTTSLIGVSGMPTIKTTSTATYGEGSVLALANGFSGWIYNLHLIGTWDGTTISGSEWNHGIDVGCVNGVTIQGNLIEKMRGDGISTDYCASQRIFGNAQNVIVASNTTRDTWRCGMGITSTAKDWVYRDNVIDKQVNFVSGIDFEPFQQGDTVTRIEVLYNKFVMNNRNPLTSPSSGSASGKAVFGWAAVSNPGTDFYIHHNYGTFGTGFGSFDGPFGNVYQASNVEGSSPPN